MSPPSRRAFLIQLAASSLLLAGCGPRPPLRVAAHAWLGYEPMFLARQKGWLDETRVRLVETPSASDSMHLLSSGRVEAAALTLDEVLRARALGLPLGVILVLDVSAGADGVLARSPMGLGQLRGARIGVEQSAVGALMLAVLLERAGLAKEEIEPVYLAYHEHAAAWRAGRVDVLITFEPALSALEQEGAVRIFDSRAMPELIVDVLAVCQDPLTRHHDTLRHLVEATLRGVEAIAQNPAQAVTPIAERLGQAPETVLAGLRGIRLADLAHNRDLLLGRPPPLLERAHEVAVILQGAGLLPSGNGMLEEKLFHGLIHAEYLPRA